MTVRRENFFKSDICKEQRVCVSCRQSNHFRQLIQKGFASIKRVDFSCPLGKQVSTSPLVEKKLIREIRLLMDSAEPATVDALRELNNAANLRVSKIRRKKKGKRRKKRMQPKPVEATVPQETSSASEYAPIPEEVPETKAPVRPETFTDARDSQLTELQQSVQSTAVILANKGNLIVADTSVRKRRISICLDCDAYPCHASLAQHICCAGRTCPVSKWFREL